MEVQEVFLRTEHNYDRDAASDESALFCPEPSRTQQSMAEECDINTIMRKFGKTGEIPVGVRMPEYGDFTGVYDYHSAMNAVATAKESFDRLPADVRARFHNDPQELLEFVENEENGDEAVKLGLAVRRASELVQAPASGPAEPSPPASGQEPVKAPAQSPT